MPSNYVVLRNSPDWLAYNDRQSRDFCVRLGLPENTIIEFISVWDAVLGVDYRRFRHAVKEIALTNFSQVRDSIFLDHTNLCTIAPKADDLFVFVDDDDWLAPDLFMRLRDRSFSDDGATWGSIRVGPVFSRSPETQEHGVLYARPIDQILYTNNYAVTGRALMRLQVEQLFEHFDAQKQFDSGAYKPTAIPEYLSVANKHPCSTMAVLFFMSLASFRSDPRADIAGFARALSLSTPNPPWIVEPVRKLRDLLETATGRLDG